MSVSCVVRFGQDGRDKTRVFLSWVLGCAMRTYETFTVMVAGRYAAREEKKEIIMKNIHEIRIRVDTLATD